MEDKFCYTLKLQAQHWRCYRQATSFSYPYDSKLPRPTPLGQ